MKSAYTVQRAIKRGGKIHEAGAVMRLTGEEAARLVEIGALELVGSVVSTPTWLTDAEFDKAKAEQAALEKAAQQQAEADRQAQAEVDRAAKAATKPKGKK